MARIIINWKDKPAETVEIKQGEGLGIIIAPNADQIYLTYDRWRKDYNITHEATGEFISIGTLEGDVLIQPSSMGICTVVYAGWRCKVCGHVQRTKKARDIGQRIPAAPHPPFKEGDMVMGKRGGVYLVRSITLGDCYATHPSMKKFSHTWTVKAYNSRSMIPNYMNPDKLTFLSHCKYGVREFLREVGGIDTKRLSRVAARIKEVRSMPGWDKLSYEAQVIARKKIEKEVK